MAVARKQHSEFSGNIDLIDMLPPGLYEATFEAKTEDTANPDLVLGDWVMRCEARTLDDIRALGGNEAADERRFAAAARVSQVNLGLYRTFVQPIIRALFPPAAAACIRQFHPLRLQYQMFAGANPLVQLLEAAAKWVRENRKPAGADNPFVEVQEAVSGQIVWALDAWRDIRDTFQEWMFLSVYGSPLLQATVGLDSTSAAPLRKAGKSPLHRELLQARIAELKSRIATGGLQECAVRGLIYVGLAGGRVDERGVQALRSLRLMEDRPRMTLSQFKTMAREQFFMLLLDPEAALAAIPHLLPPGAEDRRKAFAAIRHVLSTSGKIAGGAAERLALVARLFGVDAASAGSPSLSEPPHPKKVERANTKAS